MSTILIGKYKARFDTTTTENKSIGFDLIGINLVLFDKAISG